MDSVTCFNNTVIQFAYIASQLITFMAENNELNNNHILNLGATTS